MDDEKSEKNPIIQTMELKLKNILYSVNYCGLCFETDNDLCTMDMDFEYSCCGKSDIKFLEDVVDCLFYDVPNVPASQFVCKKCKEIIVNAYTFIINAKETSKIVNNYINDFISKTVDLNNQLEPDCNYVDSNVIIVLENYEETTRNPIEIKVLNTDKNVTVKKQNTDQLVVDKLAKRQVLPSKKARIETKHNNVSLNKEKEASTIKLQMAKTNIIMIPRTQGYECTKCKVIFTTYKLWKDHERDFHKQAVKCKICSKTFDSHRILTEHYKLHNKLKCRICNNFVLDTELQEHLRLYHEDETYCCEYCDKIYYTAPALIAHIKINHFNVKAVDEDDENPQCLMCLQYFKKEDLKTHKCKDKCPDCTEIPCIHYKYLIHYKEQVLNHTSKIKCLDCDYVCRRKDSFIGHVNREHIDYHPFTCTHCGTQFFSKYRLKCHISTFHTEIISCEYCDKMFSSKSLYDRHVALCKIEKRQFGCNKCSASFVTADELFNHDKMKHTEETFPCDLCNKVFITEENIREHKLRTHRRVQLKKQMKWVCLLCDEKYDTKGEYRQHMESHGPDVKYICRICNIECKDLQNLQWHNRSHKKKVKKAEKCTICYKVVMSLRTHMFRHRAVMNNMEQCICNICGKTFLCKNQLRVHMMIHLDKVPCKVCTKLVKPSTMYKHMRIHKGTVVKKKRKCLAVCEYCDYIPPCLPSLEAHVNKYHLNIKPYICAVCGQAFCAENQLKQHSVVHSDEKKYQCKICDNKFRYKNSLSKHMLLHTGEKSHICDICGERFICLSSLKEHKLKHTEKTIGCPLCDTMFYSIKLMRMHFKKQHWKDKERKFNPKEILDEEFHYLFEDRRKVSVDIYKI